MSCFQVPEYISNTNNTEGHFDGTVKDSLCTQKLKINVNQIAIKEALLRCKNEDALKLNERIDLEDLQIKPSQSKKVKELFYDSSDEKFCERTESIKTNDTSENESTVNNLHLDFIIKYWNEAFSK
jgi:hypothetical protein